MTDFSFVLLYVADPGKSAAFYTDLLGHTPVEASPTFAMLPLRHDVMLGLWKREGVEPAPVGLSGASEIALTVADARAVHTTHASWASRGIRIAQEPTRMDFGHTFTAMDPDGHRIRVLAPEGP
ncbi:MAG: VOC family protein [Rhizobiales bacterium]|nr:VOC family protein [Hyphomicrobiales bacterium]